MTAVDRDAEEISRMCLPFRANPESPDAIVAARTLLSLGRDVEGAIRFTEGMHPSQRDPIRRMATIAGKMVSDPALLALLERVAGSGGLPRGADFFLAMP